MKLQIEEANMQKISILGMTLDEWTYKSCLAHVATGSGWATLYDIRSKEEGKGHATYLLQAMKRCYESQGLDFGGSIALNDRMRKLYLKCGIKEYTQILVGYKE